MSKFMIGFQVFLTLVFFTGLRLADDVPERCQKMMKEKRMKYIVNEKEWTVPDETNAVCKDVMEISRCYNDEFGIDFKTPPHFLLEGEDGIIFKAITMFARHAEEICTKDGKINNLLLSVCFGKAIKVLEECRLQSLDAFESFWNPEINMSITLPIDQFCLVPLYQGGCVGVAVLEECGDEAFDTFADAARSLYQSFVEIFQVSTMCSSDITQTVKTSFINSLNMTESHIRVYRRIFDMDKENRIRTPDTSVERTIGVPVSIEHCEKMTNRMTTKYTVDKVEWMLSTGNNAICIDLMELLRCYQGVSSFDLKTPPDFLLQSDNGYIFKAAARIVSLVEEFCTEDSKIRKLVFSPCFGKAINALRECMKRTEDDFETFRNHKIKMDTTKPLVNICILPGYEGGCVGVAVLEECGKESLDTFIDTFRDIYQITIYLLGMNTLCSSAITQTVETSFFEGLNVTESHKSVYRVIFDMDNGKENRNNGVTIDIAKGERNTGNLLMNNYCLCLLMIFFIYSTEKYLYIF